MYSVCQGCCFFESLFLNTVFLKIKIKDMRLRRVFRVGLVHYE